MGNMMKRKMKRTKMQEYRLIESMNQNSIDHLMQQQYGLAQALSDLQKNFMALMNILKRRGVVDELAMHRALGEIEEFERMKKLAINVDPNKPEVKSEEKPEEKIDEMVERRPG